MSQRRDFQTGQFDRVWHESVNASEIVRIPTCSEKACILPAGLGGYCTIHRPTLFELKLLAMVWRMERNRKARLKQLRERPSGAGKAEQK